MVKKLKFEASVQFLQHIFVQSIIATAIASPDENIQAEAKKEMDKLEVQFSNKININDH